MCQREGTYEETQRGKLGKGGWKRGREQERGIGKKVRMAGVCREEREAEMLTY